MTGAQEMEIYLLRRYFGISAHDALHVMPAWEVDLLVDTLTEELSPNG